MVDALAELRILAPLVRIVVVTNQRGVATGAMPAGAVDEIHDRMRRTLRAAGADVDAVEVCPHETGTCDCRKPALGLFRRAMERWPDIDPTASVVVGDSAADLLAGTRLGARTCLVGDAGRRARVRAEAMALGARIDSEADSLADLVTTGPLVAWLSSPVGPSEVGR